MENANDSGRLFGNLALGLLVAGLLVPFIIAIFAREELAMGFGAVALVLALVFGILGWKHKTGKVSALICAVLVMLSAVATILTFKHDKAKERAIKMLYEREANRRQ